MKRYSVVQRSHSLNRKLFAYVAACALALGVMIPHGEQSLAEEERPSALSSERDVVLSGADLEERFWICDYVASTRGVHATPAGLCSSLYDQLKAAKFDGYFGQLLTWWQQNKSVEHERLASGTW